MTKELILSKGKVTIVDDEDYEWASKYKWSVSSSLRAFYAVRTGRNSSGRETTIYLHREILQAPKEMQVDHINGNGLDNRRENLRLATSLENNHNSSIKTNNTSGYKGVYWHKAAGKWLVRIRVNYTRINLGLFTDLVEAAKAYDDAARKHHGDFAKLNFPE